jgi:hypothetical protein
MMRLSCCWVGLMLPQFYRTLASQRNALSDGGDVPGLRLFPASSSCGVADSLRYVHFTYMPPANMHLQPPPNNQVSFCLSLRLSSQAPSAVVMVMVMVMMM